MVVSLIESIQTIYYGSKEKSIALENELFQLRAAIKNKIRADQYLVELRNGFDDAKRDADIKRAAQWGFEDEVFFKVIVIRDYTIIRILLQSSQDGNIEHVFFTEDFDTPSGEFIIPGCSLDSDSTREMDLPDGFPLETELKRK